MKGRMDEATATLTRPEPDIPEVHFESGLPGFSEAHRFVLTPWGAQDALFSVLRCLDCDGLEFVVVPPASFFPDYAPELGDNEADQLGLSEADDALLLVILNVPDRAEDATANLLGPIIINRHTHRALQAILSGQWSTRQPLFAGTAEPSPDTLG